ncbi:recombinase family protein [Haloimpatiens lingqiaonensis]|uniref:recombinase family protein n=1 Tax=Haloimpatiens lingqiaonensis TaxID=1380675 RepID=UPI0010FDA714|nr:recombinase family protein [Haloimpatiens lingqiaonensis]
MLIGYARVSTTEQNLDRQIDALTGVGVDKRNIYMEKITGTKKDRPMLIKLIDELQEGDTVIITELTRLSRSTKDLFEIVEKIGNKKANIKSLKESWLDTTTATGRLMFTIIAGLTQFERDLVSERTKDGLAAARARGRSGGRPRKSDKDIQKAIKLYNSREYTIKEITEMTGISKPTLYRYIADFKEA